MSEMDRITARIQALEKEMEAIREPASELVLGSPNGRFRMRIRLSDDGSLLATALLQDAAGNWKVQPGAGEKKLL